MPRPYRLLDTEHLAAVRQVLRAHPGLSLRSLCEPVRAACALPSMNECTLHRFIERHRLDRALPEHAHSQAQSRAGVELARLWPAVIAAQEHAA